MDRFSQSSESRCWPGVRDDGGELGLFGRWAVLAEHGFEQTPRERRGPPPAALRVPDRARAPGERSQDEEEVQYQYPPWVPHPQAAHHQLHPATRSSIGPKRQAIHAKMASRPKTMIPSASGPGDTIGTATRTGTASSVPAGCGATLAWPRRLGCKSPAGRLATYPEIEPDCARSWALCRPLRDARDQAKQEPRDSARSLPKLLKGRLAATSGSPQNAETGSSSFGGS
jgi:hypothetical protein